MEVKEILDKIRQSEKEKKEYFFALEIDRGIVKSAIWMVEKGEIKITALGSNEIWEEEKELLSAVDASLSAAAENFSPEEEAIEPSKVIFGLPASWIKEEKITPGKLEILKKLSQKLELEPVGFVVIQEAASHYLKATEGVPPTAILLGLSKDRLSLTLIRLGKVSPSHSVKRSQSLGDDVVEGLSRYEKEGPYPARLLLYDGENELEADQQELADYPWQEEKAQEKEVTFLHLPKVEILASDFDIKAVALAGGKEVVKAAGVMADFVVKKKTPVPSEPPRKEPEEEVASMASNFGFIEGEDILKKELAVEKKAHDLELPKEEAEKKPDLLPVDEPRSSFEPDKGVPPQPKKTSFFQLILSKLKAWPRPDFSRLLTLFSGLSSRTKFQGRGFLIAALVIVFLLVLAGVTVALYWRLPKASVILLVEPKVLEEEFQVTLDPSLSTADREKAKLPAEEVKTSLEGQKKSGTTGSKLTGEKAKGEVTIYNATSNEKVFASETVITSQSGIEFFLDDEVKIASQSGTAADPKPGKATVKVTAAEIGTEGNLAAKTEFAVANYSRSDFVAENETALSGGTSREIQVVSEEDQENLLTDLTEELEDQSLEKLKEKVPSGKTLLEESMESDKIKETYSQDVGEEATEVSLNLKLELTALAYDEEEMRSLIEGVIKDKAPADFEFRPEESEIDFSLQKMSEKGTAIFDVNLSANFVPQFDLEKIKGDLKGKYPLLGRTYLENLPNVVGVEVKITPRLPAKLLVFPRRAENIEIKVEIQ